MFGTTIDLTNFYWSVRMPAELRDLFRLEGADFHSLPFGWNYSPLIAPETLGDLIRRNMGRFAGSGVVHFHYLYDILLLGRDRALLRVVTRGLCKFLQTQSLLLSTKSQTEPSALVTWIGKNFDLARGTMCNTPGTIRKALAVVLRAVVSNLTPKRVERVIGRL